MRGEGKLVRIETAGDRVVKGGACLLQCEATESIPRRRSAAALSFRDLPYEKQGQFPEGGTSGESSPIRKSGVIKQGADSADSILSLHYQPHISTLNAKRQPPADD